MLGYTLKKRLNKRNIKKIYNFYKKTTLSLNLFIKNNNAFLYSIFLYLPSRQHNVCIRDSKTSKIYSAGLIIKQNKTKLKFYKRTTKVNSNIILFLQKTYGKKISQINLFFFKNFNMRSWVFFQKYLLLANPSFNWIILKKSYNTNLSSVRRIKRRVLRAFKNK